MAQPGFALPAARAATPLRSVPDPDLPAGALPADWTVLTGADTAGIAADRVVVGPNGVFTVVVDPDHRPAVITSDGLRRDGVRVTTAVKDALAAAFAMRRLLSDDLPDVFPYPVLALRGEVAMGFVGRLRVAPIEAVPEAVWSHCGRPLRRSERAVVLDALRT